MSPLDKVVFIFTEWLLLKMTAFKFLEKQMGGVLFIVNLRIRNLVWITSLEFSVKSFPDYF